jgi:chorismate mutase
LKQQKDEQICLLLAQREQLLQQVAALKQLSKKRNAESGKEDRLVSSKLEKSKFS